MLEFGRFKNGRTARVEAEAAERQQHRHQRREACVRLLNAAVDERGYL